MVEQCSLKSARGRWILAATILASGSAFLMGTVVTVALPTIQTHFGIGITGLQWVVNSQLLVLAALLLIGGSLGDLYGRKRIFLLGIAIFAVGALLSGLASTSIERLIAFQAVMGVGAALMIPQSLALINVCFSEGERGQAIGLWAGLSGGLAIIGPWLGGWVVERFGWQAVFFIPVFLLVATFIVTSRLVQESKNPEAKRLDWRGTLLVFFGLLGLSYGLVSGPAVGWGEPLVLASLIGGAILLVAFVFFERRQKEPVLPLHIFKEPLVLGANLVTLFVYFALYGVIFFVVLNLQQVQNLSPTLSGLGLLPAFVIITFASGPSGRLSDRIGPRRQMILGPVLVAVGIALLTTGGAPANYFKDFLPGLVLLGGGMALVIAPLTKSALYVAPQFSGAASGFNNAVSRIAALLAVAVLGGVMLTIFSSHISGALPASGLTPEQQAVLLSQADRLGGIVIPETFDETARQLAEQVVRGSFVYAFRWVMGISAGLAAIGALVSSRKIHNPPPGGTPAGDTG